MNRDKRKQIFVHREIRKSFLDRGEKINISKYCILDMIRRFIKNDTGVFEYKKQYISEWLGIKPSTLSEHLQYLQKTVQFIEYTDLGIRLTNKFPIDLYYMADEKPCFVIIDLEIKEELQNNFGCLTFEQFAILTTIFGIRLKKERRISKLYLSSTLMFHRDTISTAITKLITMDLLENNPKQLRLTEDAEMYFEPLKKSIRSFTNNFGVYAI